MHNMARPYRLRSEDCCYHIMSRGNDRKKIFLRSRDYKKFMAYISAAKEKFDFYLYAYCLMPNHYHLLAETKLPNISRIMQYVNGSYTIYSNSKYRRCGHLFQGRFKSIVVEKDRYFLILSRYIHLNPVRTGIVSAPDEYAWSSYHGYVGGKDTNIDFERVKSYLDMNRSQYREFVLAGIGKDVDPLEDVYAGFLLGSKRFIKDKLQHLKNQITCEEVSHRKTLMNNDITKEVIITSVTKRYKISLDDLHKSKARTMRARQVAIYLLRKYSALTNREIGEEFNMKHSAISKAGLLIENLIRNDRNLRRKVEGIISNFEV